VNKNTATAYQTYEVFSHVVAAGESNSYVFKPQSAQREHVWIAADTTAASIDKSSNAFIKNVSAYTAPSVTPSRADELALAFNLPEAGSTATWTNPAGWTRAAGPTSVWKGEALTRPISSTSAVSESATLSSAAWGFAGLVVLSPSTSSSTSSAGTPAPTASPVASVKPTATPTVTPTTAPVGAPTAAPTAIPVAAGSASYHGCPLFAANDWFTTNLISGGSSYVPSTVDPNSASIISNLSNAYSSGLNFSKDSYPDQYAVNIDNESSSWFMTPVVHAGTWYGFYNDAFGDDSNSNFPVTNGTFLQEGTDGCTQSGGDCHVVVLDTVKCVDYEGFGKNSSSQPQLWDNGKFVAEGGGVTNLRHAFNPAQRVQVTAAGLPLMGGTDWGEDETTYNQSSCRTTNSCVIPHSVQFLLPNPNLGIHGYVAPATAETTPCSVGSSYCGSSNTLPYGARLRLKSSYACPSAASYPQANMLCNQAKQYGWIFADTTAWSGAGGVRLGVSSNGSDPWNTSDINQFLGNVKLSNFDVMTLGTVHT
jgi:hypothetical protein